MNEIKGVEEHLKKKSAFGEIPRANKQKKTVTRTIASSSAKARVATPEWANVGAGKDPSKLTKKLRGFCTTAQRSCHEGEAMYVLSVITVDVRTRHSYENMTSYRDPEIARVAKEQVQVGLSRKVSVVGNVILYRFRKVNGRILIHEVG